jgi:hypothetical protein
LVFPSKDSPFHNHGRFLLLLSLFRPRFCIWEERYSICLSEFSLPCSIWWSLVPAIFFCKQHNFILLFCQMILQCFSLTHFLYPFICYWTLCLTP